MPTPTKPEVVEEKKLNIYEKLAAARSKIAEDSTITKGGRNEYSKYDYFTPEQVEKIIQEVNKEFKILCLTNFRADELGLYQELELINLEDLSDRLEFELRTERGQLKATNETQQMGGTDTYSERYLKMKVYQIKDNNLDMDSKDNRQAEVRHPGTTASGAPTAATKSTEAFQKADLDNIPTILLDEEDPLNYLLS